MNRKLFNILMIFVLTLSSATVALADADDGDAISAASQGALKSYIVVMAEDPLVAYEGDIAGYRATRPTGTRKIDPNSDAVQKYESFLEKSHTDVLAKASVSAGSLVHQYTYALNGFSAIMTEAEAKAVGSQAGVRLVLEDQMRYPQTDSSPAFMGLTVKDGAYDSGITGEGVVVGIIDTGIWPEHPSFADDGSYAVPPTGPLPCEFGNTAWNPNDAPFTCNNKLIGAYQMLDTYRALTGADPDEFDSARDDDGHGTHTASTAAGNAGVNASMFGLPVATISGIAPRAHVIAYKGLGNLGGYTSDLAASVDQAVEDGVDVINYSIGGGAAGPGADEIAFLFADDAGVFVATSAGNSGPGAATVGNPGTMPWLTTVGASTQRRFFKGTILLGNKQKFEGASLTPEIGWAPLVDGADVGSEYCVIGALDPAQVAGKIVLCKRGVNNRADKSLAVLQAGGVGVIHYEASDINNLFTDSHWVPTVHIDNTPGLAIKAYIASEPKPMAMFITRFKRGCFDKLYAREGVSFERDAGKGGKQDKVCRPLTTAWPYAPSMTYFSSRGPNPVSPDIIKPDVTAPGLQILAGASPFPDPDSTPPGELFQAIAGTSMSSPHVAGIFALLKQAHPEWTPAMAKSALMTTAYQNVRDNDRVSPADPFDMGAGHVNPGGKWVKGSITQPGLVYDAGLFDYAAYTCGMEFGVFTPGSCDFLESIGVPSEPYNLNYPSIGIAELPGSMTVVRTVTSVADQREKFIASVVAPEGYEVTVDPSVLVLDPGESATFEVTIANDGSAPAGEWRFGSLTWMGAGYSVKSPIAVKAALFAAPAEVTGSGESGATSFDVSFGYTGSYTAAPHGLIAATVTSDNVLQDPDATFSPGDVAGGGANLHEFTLSGAALFRIAMPPEATEPNADLDIFVYDPSNVQVASSTAGGTNELIDLVLPADGTWKVYVHGWSAPGGDSDYDMWTWAVPLASGGSLSLDAAPAAATVGATETIDISWAGLTSGGLGDWYLGAVSHTGDIGLMGLTLVNVDNR